MAWGDLLDDWFGRVLLSACYDFITVRLVFPARLKFDNYCVTAEYELSEGGGRKNDLKLELCLLTVIRPTVLFVAEAEREQSRILMKLH